MRQLPIGLHLPTVKYSVFASRHFVERQLECHELDLPQRGLGLEVQSLGHALDVQIIVPDHLSSPERWLEFSGDELHANLIRFRVISYECPIQRKRLTLEEVRK